MMQPTTEFAKLPEKNSNSLYKVVARTTTMSEFVSINIARSLNSYQADKMVAELTTAARKEAYAPRQSKNFSVQI